MAPPVLMTCDADGASSAQLDAVRAHAGRVWTVPYSEWQDDGFGGPSAAIQTPPEPYTKADCERVLRKWLDEIL